MNFAIAAASTPLPVATQSASGPDHRKLTDAAQQFEGMLLEEMLKPMREHGLGHQGSDDTSSDEGGGGDTLSSFGTEVMATAIAKSGGLGIARRIVAQVEDEQRLRTHTPSEPGPSEFQNKTLTVLKSAQNPSMN
jgi:flagellar protein FlgJ